MTVVPVEQQLWALHFQRQEEAQTSRGALDYMDDEEDRVLLHYHYDCTCDSVSVRLREGPHLARAACTSQGLRHVTSHQLAAP
jgi:hypothetical protein